MKRKLYELLPKSIRESIYQANARQFNESEIERLRIIEESLPAAELSAVYIANLQVLTDRHALLTALPKQAIVGEIGVHNGEFSDKILTIAGPKKLHLIGNWSQVASNNGDVKRHIALVENKFRAEIHTGQVTVSQGDPCVEFESFPDGYFDWVFLDSAYSFESATQWLNRCRAKVKTDGIIAGRNYGTGSIRYREHYGVIEAVNEFCKKNGWELFYLTNERHRNLSYAMRKMG